MGEEHKAIVDENSEEKNTVSKCKAEAEATKKWEWKIQWNTFEMARQMQWDGWRG